MSGVYEPGFGWCHVAAGTQHKAYLRTKLASKLRSQASHYDSHATVLALLLISELTIKRI